MRRACSGGHRALSWEASQVTPAPISPGGGSHHTASSGELRLSTKQSTNGLRQERFVSYPRSTSAVGSLLCASSLVWGSRRRRSPYGPPVSPGQVGNHGTTTQRPFQLLLGGGVRVSCPHSMGQVRLDQPGVPLRCADGEKMTPHLGL